MASELIWARYVLMDSNFVDHMAAALPGEKNLAFSNAEMIWRLSAAEIGATHITY
jgi:hypothetical protein